jgi:lauroyl/myristoyl acyltransferase/acyl carrier protein
MDSGFNVLEKTDSPSDAPGTQSTLTELWSRVLEVDHIDPEENFFLLGGDSLRAATLFAEIDATFGVLLPIETIYDDGETVAGMAALIDRLTAQSQDAPLEAGDASAGASEVFGPVLLRDEAAPIPRFDENDLTTVLTLLSLATICWLPGVTLRSALCRQIAKTHIAMGGSRAAYLEDVLPFLERYECAADLERDILAGGYEEMATALRDYLPQRNPPKARLKGQEHIDDALAAGRGAVLWNTPGAPGSRAGVRCLADAGFDIAQLRSFAHPYSGSRFGMKFLNPIANRIDDRYAKTPVVLNDDNAIDVMQELGEHLGKNMLVRMSANGSSGTPYEMPFLGGRLRLALGAPTLALLHGAPLIPTFCIPDGAGGFDLVADAPLMDESDLPIGDRARSLANQYAERLASFVKQNPQVWRCWYMRNTWRAGA